MNEKVTNKTPKRRRWIARLLVSALCVLLASSLLFVGVAADNIVLVAQFSSNKAVSVDTLHGFIPFDDSDVLYWSGNSIYISSSTYTATFSYPYENINRLSCALEGSFLYVASQKTGGYVLLTCYDVSDPFSFFEVFHVESSFWSEAVASSSGYGPLIVASNDIVYGIVGRLLDGGLVTVTPFVLKDEMFLSFDTLAYRPDISGVTSSSVFRSNVFFVNDCFYVPYIRLCYNFVSQSRLSVSDTYPTERSAVFTYEGDYYLLTSSHIYSLDLNTRSFSVVGDFSFSSSLLSAYASDGVLTVYGAISNASVPYTVYTGLPTTESPPESSDETTEEPPPESSDESSEESSENTLKIWKTEFERDGSFASVALTTIDSSNVETIRAFLGGVAASDSDVSYDGSSVLSVELIDSGGSTIDILTFGFSAWGFALADGYTENFTFPDYVGYWFTLPYSGQQDLYFADVSPFGSVLINSYDSVDGTSARVGINLTSVDSYCKFDFGGEDVFGIRVFNANPDGNFKQFDFGVKSYKEYYYSSSGSSLESDWISVPDSSDEGYSLTFTSSDIVDNGLYGFFLKASKSVYPSINSERLDQISLDYELLESKANDLYGQFSFDSLLGDNFGGAVDEFNDIKDSSGGSYVLNYLLGMWSIHPFASSMIAIVGTLAIVGFIIRKM